MQTEFPPVTVPAGWTAALGAFGRHRVQFVVAGPAAEAVVGGEVDDETPLVVAPAPYRRNLENLARALAELDVRTRGRDGRTHAIEPDRVAQHPAVHWHLVTAGTALSIIGSAVGDGEFSIRLWRTKPIELVSGDMRVTAEIELAASAPRVPA